MAKKNYKKVELNMSKSSLIISAVLIVFIIGAAIFLLMPNESRKIAREYRQGNLPSDHILTYITESELNRKVAAGETFFVYYGSASCPFCMSSIETINRIAVENDIETLYYMRADFSNTAHVARADRLEERYKGTVKLNASSTPNIYVFKNGGLVRQLSLYYATQEQTETGFINNRSLASILNELYGYGL